MEWIVVAGVLAFVISALMARRKSDGFKSAASTLGLRLSRSVPDLLPRLEGMVDGLAVRIEVINDQSVRYCVFYPDLGVSLRLQRETEEVRRAGPELTGDHQTGNRAFDRTFRVNTSRPDALRQMLTSDLSRQLVALSDQYPQAVISDGDITYVAPGVRPEPDTIVGIVGDLTAAAAALVAARPPELQRPQTRPTPPRQPQPERKPAAEPARPTPRADADPTEASEPVAAPSQPTPPPPPPEPPAPQAGSSGLPDGFFDDVFGENRLSFEDDDTFHREIRGTRVRLRGTVKQSSPYSDRSELSPPSGTKAVITVAKIETDLYGKTDIDAVVHLAGTVDLNRGDEVSFSGTIDGVDAFMRNVFVQDASITG